ISSPLINRAIAALLQLGRSGSFGDNANLQEIEFFANADDSQLLLGAYCASDTQVESAKQLVEMLWQVLPEVVGAVAFKTSIPDPSGKRNDEPQEIASAGAKE